MMRSATAEEVAANPPRYADGCPLVVTRSDGTKSECTVLAYDAPHKAYKVSIDGTDITEMAAEKMLEYAGAHIGHTLPHTAREWPMRASLSLTAHACLSLSL